MAVSVVSQWASALRNELFPALVDVPDSRDSRQSLSQANGSNQPVAEVDLIFVATMPATWLHCVVIVRGRYGSTQ